MDPDSVKSTLSNLAFGNVMAAAARDYQKELLAQEKAQPSSLINQEVDLDELMDDPELERLHADRIAALKKEAEKRQELKRHGHGEYRDITEGDFLGEVTGSEKVICHFYHKEFYRCKIMDKHLKSLAPKHVDTKFIKLDAENAPFFVAKLVIKTLPCVVLFRKGIAEDRLVGFQDLRGKDDFTTRMLEAVLVKKAIISEKNDNEDDEDGDYPESRRQTVRSSADAGSDSDLPTHQKGNATSFKLVFRQWKTYFSLFFFLIIRHASQILVFLYNIIFKANNTFILRTLYHISFVS